MLFYETASNQDKVKLVVPELQKYLPNPPDFDFEGVCVSIHEVIPRQLLQTSCDVQGTEKSAEIRGELRAWALSQEDMPHACK